MHKRDSKPLRLADCGDVLTVDELRRVLKIGKNAAYELVASGTIPPIAIGSSRRLVASHSVACFLGQRVEPPPGLVTRTEV